MNFLKLSDFSRTQIFDILDMTSEIKRGAVIPNYKNKIACNLFFEPSTRTHYSFSFAELRLGMRSIDFAPESSSILKGESFYDTVKTFDSYHPNVMIIRDSKTCFFDELQGIKTPIINAGDGTNSHPTQTMLDLFTICEEFNCLTGIVIGLIGDISHSRVAASLKEVGARMGMKFIEYDPIIEGKNKEKFKLLIKSSDVIMPLRIQFERDTFLNSITKEEYFKMAGIRDKYIHQMKDDAIIMHPAPFNRGVEIEDSVVECEKSRIFKQMENGMYVRMAIIDYILRSS